MQRIKITFLLLIILILAGCSEEPFEGGYLRIYDLGDYQSQLATLAISEMDNGGTILLNEYFANSASTSVPHLLITDDAGLVVRDTLLSSHGIPVGTLGSIGGNFYFVSMTPDTYQANLVTINSEGTVTDVNTVAGTQFPLAANTTGDQIVLLSYDSENQNSVLSLVNSDGSIASTASYTIGPGSDASQRILEHFFERDRRLPFFTGQMPSGRYYFNGVYNYTLSLVFSDMSANPTGVIQGQGYSGGVTSILHEVPMAIAGFQFTDNFWQVNTTIDETSTSSSVDYLDRTIQGIKSKANTQIVHYQHAGTNYSVVATESENRQTAIYFMEESNGNLAALTHVGFANPYTLKSIKVSSDNSLIISGTTYVNGQFERPYLKKMSPDEISRILD